jgi:hypothetical protein
MGFGGALSEGEEAVRSRNLWSEPVEMLKLTSLQAEFNTPEEGSGPRGMDRKSAGRVPWTPRWYRTALEFCGIAEYRRVLDGWVGILHIEGALSLYSRKSV